MMIVYYFIVLKFTTLLTKELSIMVYFQLKSGLEVENQYL